MQRPNESSKKRITVLFYILLLLMGVLVARLAQLMFFNAKELGGNAETQWTRDIAEDPGRADITDRNGEILASSAQAQSVLLWPQKIKDAGEVSALLSGILKMDEQYVYEQASNTEKVEIWLKRQITDEQVEAIRKLGLDGVGFFEDVKRYYPLGGYMSQLIGYTTADGVGQTGIEKAFEKTLTGEAGSTLAKTDAKGNVISGSEETYIETIRGKTLVLTLDAFIQNFTEAAAKKAYDAYEAESVTAIVMDPDNGEVLAMANVPETDLNHLDRSDTRTLFALTRNRAVTDAEQPGTLMNAITLASAIDSGIHEESTVYSCDDESENNGLCLRRGWLHGSVSGEEALLHSCDSAFGALAEKMGRETLASYDRAFGFGKKSGIETDGEAAGTLKKEKEISGEVLRAMGTGYEMSATPLQMARAYCALVNGGRLLAPRAVLGTKDDEGNLKGLNAGDEETAVISAVASDTLRALLEESVERGMGAGARIPGYRVGGIGGTSVSGTEEEGQKVVSSFVAFAPADDPKYLVLITVRDPQTEVPYGEAVASFYASEILENCLRYGAVPETGHGPVLEAPDFRGLTEKEARQFAAENGITVTFIGEGSTLAQFPAIGKKILAGSTVTLFGKVDTEIETEETGEVPDLLGKNISEAYTLLKKDGFKMKISGPTGQTIRWQSARAGARAVRGTLITVECE